MYLAPAATSGPFTARPQQRNFPALTKPALSSTSQPSHLSALVPTPALAPARHQRQSGGDVSSDVLIAEEQIGRSQAKELSLPSSLSLLLNSDVRSMDDRVRYVHLCLQAIRAQQAASGAKGFTGPQEELAYAIQQLESAISSKATPAQRQQLHYVIEHATRDQQLPASLRPQPPSGHHELSGPHRIVSEDVIPQSSSSVDARQLYSLDGSDVVGYRKAAEESERLQEARRAKYAVLCLQSVEERQRAEEHEQRQAAKQAGPEDQLAYSMISRQARAAALRSKL